MKKASRKVVAEGRYLRMVSAGGWEFAERSRGLEAVAMIAVTDAGELILTEQYRVPLGKNVIDLPAGLVGDEVEGEDLAVAAKRELEEETGYRARMKKVFSGPTSAGLSNEVVNLLLARGVKKVGDGGGVEGESIVVHLVPVEKVLSWCRRYERRSGGMIAPNVIAALALLAE